MPSHPMRRKTDKIRAVKNIIYILTATGVFLGGILSTGWTLVVKPKVVKEVECQLRPIQKNIEYQNFLLMSALSDEQIEWANKRYSAGAQK